MVRIVLLPLAGEPVGIGTFIDLREIALSDSRFMSAVSNILSSTVSDRSTRSTWLNALTHVTQPLTSNPFVLDVLKADR